MKRWCLAGLLMNHDGVEQGEGLLDSLTTAATGTPFEYSVKVQPKSFLLWNL